MCMYVCIVCTLHAHTLVPGDVTDCSSRLKLVRRHGSSCNHTLCESSTAIGDELDGAASHDNYSTTHH
ncbi:uncharacterized protein YALI1_F36945g [Yarrowia lipolytica]|uniref:Uncharacterized protein n=1 Tax=Yarrowia lipolytica TaxID=4952 RepID=A0A1D8NQF7_YARLL|nr:hypothetical protein YALI1_F36945g [Yarrowia lipolytica]